MVRIGVDEMKRFIYVFSEDARDVLLAKGYGLLKSDAKNGMFVFENRNDLCFALDSVEHLLSDTLTF